MKDRSEIEAMAKRAYAAQGWRVDGGRTPPADEKEHDARVYADGVEAGLLWVLGKDGDPFPRAN